MIDGSAISTRMIVNVALQVSPRGDGNDAAFAQLSSRATPCGSSHWVRIDGDQLAPANDLDFYRGNRNFAPSRSSGIFQRDSNGSPPDASHGARSGRSPIAAAGRPGNAPAHGK